MELDYSLATTPQHILEPSRHENVTKVPLQNPCSPQSAPSHIFGYHLVLLFLAIELLNPGEQSFNGAKQLLVGVTNWKGMKTYSESGVSDKN